MHMCVMHCCCRHRLWEWLGCQGVCSGLPPAAVQQRLYAAADGHAKGRPESQGTPCVAQMPACTWAMLPLHAAHTSCCPGRASTPPPLHQLPASPARGCHFPRCPAAGHERPTSMVVRLCMLWQRGAARGLPVQRLGRQQLPAPAGRRAVLLREVSSAKAWRAGRPASQRLRCPQSHA
jgi:hypothetical protein